MCWKWEAKGLATNLVTNNNIMTLKTVGYADYEMGIRRRVCFLNLVFNPVAKICSMRVDEGIGSLHRQLDKCVKESLLCLLSNERMVVDILFRERWRVK